MNGCEKKDRFVKSKNKISSQKKQAINTKAQTSVIYPTADDVFYIADLIAKQSNQQVIPLKDCRGKIEAAIARAQGVYFGRELFPTLFSKAAVLLTSLALAHPFSDGNKRIASAVALAFLEENLGVSITLAFQLVDEFVELVLGAVQRHVTVEEVEKWFEKNIGTIKKQGWYVGLIDSCLMKLAQNEREEELDLNSVIPNFEYILRDCVRKQVKRNLSYVVRFFNDDVYTQLCDTVWRYQLDTIDICDVDADQLDFMWDSFEDLLEDLENYIPDIEERVYEGDSGELTPFGEVLKAWYENDAPEIFEDFVYDIQTRYVEYVNGIVKQWDDKVEKEVKKYKRNHGGEEPPDEFYIQLDNTFRTSNSLDVTEEVFSDLFEEYPWERMKLEPGGDIKLSIHYT
ncbi:MAG TPA: type II toxin-antitoxin system death-on-curing family toxin [Methanofastidiosum sp.]|nr:type II toxin-antitoxin system death-on-curing family toxin [Methanofastidiosum sp.]